MRFKLRWKTSFLVISEILGLFVNTLIACNKFYCYKTEKFQQAIQIELSKKLKILYEFLVAFLEPTSNFPHAEKRDELHSSSNSESIVSEKRGYLNIWKTPFQEALEILSNFAQIFHFCRLDFDIKHPSWEHLKS